MRGCYKNAMYLTFIQQIQNSGATGIRLNLLLPKNNSFYPFIAYKTNMRSLKDIENSNRHNETKFLILRVFARPPSTYLTTHQIAEQCGLSQNNVSRAIKRLVGQGYIWRKDIGKKSYIYRYLKPMGERVVRELWIRNRISEKVGEKITMNLRKPHWCSVKIRNIEKVASFMPISNI
ncbi:MAG TPA: MarR family transcriptional regulator [Candidatus Methylomirabilis sp.]|nr:MarR family transcriptional regulator [Candidatus Methylomirabilis sp.]